MKKTKMREALLYCSLVCLLLFFLNVIILMADCLIDVTIRSLFKAFCLSAIGTLLAKIIEKLSQE